MLDLSRVNRAAEDFDETEKMGVAEVRQDWLDPRLRGEMQGIQSVQSSRISHTQPLISVLL